MKKIFFVLSYLITTSLCGQPQPLNPDGLRESLGKTKEDTNRVEILNSIAASYEFSFPDSAILYAQQALALAGKLNFYNGKWVSYSVLSRGFIGRGNYARALQVALQELKISEAENDSIRIVFSYSDIANVYNYSEYPAKALLYYNKTKLNRKIYQQFELSFSLYLGATYYYLNRLDSASYYLEISYRLDRKLARKWSTPYEYIGNVFAAKGQYDSALNYYYQARNFLKSGNASIRVSREMAKVFKERHQKDSALFYAKKSLTEAETGAFISGVANATELITQIYLESKNNDSTAKYMQMMLSAKDHLYQQSKQNLFVNEQLFTQESKQKEEAVRNKTRTYILIFGLIVMLIFLSILYRNNRQKLKSNLALKKTLGELKSTQSQLIQSEKMASLGELTAGIAHEIQNPLNFVNNFSDINKELLEEMKAELAKGNMQSASEIAGDVIGNEEKINHHGKRADAIVKSMLQHSRTSSGKKEPTDINVLADEYLRLAYHGMRAKDKSFNVSMVTHYDESIGKINVVPQDIGRVLLNLFNNAFYACTERKNLQGLENLQGLSYIPTVTIITRKENNHITIAVRDNGNGIPEKIKDKIFQPFFTTKPTGSGTGLGLSLSYDIITKEHNGTIKVESTEGEGTEFIIQLPTV